MVGRVIFFLLKMIPSNPAKISRKHFWNRSIRFRNSRKNWPKIEASCSYKIVLIIINKKACNLPWCNVASANYKMPATCFNGCQLCMAVIAEDIISHALDEHYDWQGIGARAGGFQP